MTLSPGDDDPSTEELRAVQEDKASEEERRAEASQIADERHAHERRAEKAEYLRAKLDEQAESQR